MGIFRKKSKEERDIERELAYRKARGVIKKYRDRSQMLQKRYFEKGQEASRIGDEKLLRRFAVGYLSMQEKIEKAEKISLSLEAIKLHQEEAKISTDFVGFAKEMGTSFVGDVDADTIKGMEEELEEALLKTEKVDEALTNALDVASETVIASQDLSDAELDDVIMSMEGDAEVGEGVLDSKISEGLKKVEEAMKKG